MSIGTSDEISRAIMAIVVANIQGDFDLIDQLICDAIDEYGAFDLTTGMLGFFAPFVRTFADAVGKPLDVLLQELGARLATDD
jgi:hypothetical protein